MSGDPKERPSKKVPEDERSEQESAGPLTEEEIESESVPRARPRASYDGDGSHDLSIHDD